MFKPFMHCKLVSRACALANSPISNFSPKTGKFYPIGICDEGSGLVGIMGLFYKLIYHFEKCPYFVRNLEMENSCLDV